MNDTPSQLPSSDDTESPGVQTKLFHFWRCFWLTFLVISLAYAWYSFYVPANSIAWSESYSSAKEDAVDSGKPIILFFTAKWCVPCRIMKRQVLADKQVAALINRQFIPVAIQVDDPDQAAVLAHYRVVGPPVTIVVDEQGDVLQWRAGGLAKSEFLGLLRESKTSAGLE